MPVVTSYTETGCANFMLICLKDVATQLGWTTLSDVQEAVNETLYSYGVTDIASATDMRKLRALARREVWRQVKAATAGSSDFAADGGNFHLSQIHEMASQEFTDAVNSALEYDGLALKVSPVTYTQDPYKSQEWT